MNNGSPEIWRTIKSTKTAALSYLWGFLLAFLSGLSFSLIAAIVKYLTNIHPGQLALYRFWAAASLSLPQLVSSQKNILGPPTLRTPLIFLWISSSTTGFLGIIAFRYLPIGEAAVLTSCSPAVVIVAGRVFLKESLGILHIISVVAIIVGMILIADFRITVIEAHDSYRAERIYGLSAALGSLFFTASMLLLMRKLRDVDSSVIVFTGAVIGTIGSAIITSLIGDFTLNCRGLQQWLILLLGLFSYLTVTFVTLALQHMETGLVSTVRAAFDIVLSFLWQIIIFGEKSTELAILGAVLVCMSIFIIGFMKHLSSFLPQKCLHLC